ncbi:MAG: iron dicitrate transport regulator FecR, partial [Bradyrhizobium sp.]|nr:iron dicitrate transport regulator FecR [Bradyrhizobium sp.]
TLGIRGTTGLVEVPEDGGAANANNVNIKLYPDADGHVGRIEVNDRQGARLGALTSGASGFSIRPGTGGARFAAVPLAISPQQQARDQGFVRQVHATQTVGRQIVSEQRAFRRANPGLNNRNNPARPPQQPGPNRPGQPRQPQPGPNRPVQPQQPGAPNNRQGQRPVQPGQSGQAPRPAQTTPAKPAEGGAPAKPKAAPPLPAGQPLLRPPGPPRPAPGVQRPGLQNKPAPRPKAPPRDKRKK